MMKNQHDWESNLLLRQLEPALWNQSLLDAAMGCQFAACALSECDERSQVSACIGRPFEFDGNQPCLSSGKLICNLA